MDTELSLACQEHNITLSSSHRGLEEEEVLVNDRKQTFLRDLWFCTLAYQGRSISFDFYTGIGNRKLASGWKKEGHEKFVEWWGRGDVALGWKQAIAKNAIKPDPPVAADIMYSAMSDAEACEMSFDEWCNSFGYNNDSIKALETYRACQQNGDKLRKLLGLELINELRGKEH